jgi:hypothetical protein
MCPTHTHYRTGGSGSGSGGDQNQPPSMSAAQIWVNDVDISNPMSIRVNLGIRPASSPDCDFNFAQMYVGWNAHESLNGPFPYLFSMGHFNLGDLPATSTYIRIDASSPCGTSATTGFSIGRANGTRSVANVLTITYFDQSSGRVVAKSNSYNRTFAQNIRTTALDAPSNLSMARLELTGASDSIQFGNSNLWPGTPSYSEEWWAEGTSLGRYLSEIMQVGGWQSFDNTLSYNRPGYYGPVYGFEPAAGAKISQFQWYSQTQGWVPALVIGSDIQVRFQ